MRLAGCIKRIILQTKEKSMTNKLKINLYRSLFALALVFAGAYVIYAQDARAESKWATLDGARIHYVNYGKGSDALVLIHGWTQSVDAWRDQVAEFAKRGRVIAIDLPGHGKSDKPQFSNQAVPKDQPSAPFVYSMDHFARAIDAVMRDARVKRAVLVGHSMGTPVSRQFYRKFPEKTLGIVIVDGALRPFFDKAMMDGLLVGLRGPNHRQTRGQMFGMMMGGASAETRQRITTSSLNTPQHVFVSAMEGMADASIWGEDKINVPVLAIMAKSPLFPPNVEESFRAIAPNMEFHMWEGVGHFIMMEKPKEFNAAVIEWLDKDKLVSSKR
jgi:pimeloyl-ACP methyl ester carboxylesterase